MKFEDIKVAVFDEEDEKHLAAISVRLSKIENWTKEDIEKIVKEYSTENNLKYKDLAVMIQVGLTYRRYHIGYISAAYYLGKRETAERLMFLWDRMPQK